MYVRSLATRDTGSEISAALPDGQYTLTMQLNGYDAKWLVAGVTLGGRPGRGGDVRMRRNWD